MKTYHYYQNGAFAASSPVALLSPGQPQAKLGPIVGITTDEIGQSEVRVPHDLPQAEALAVADRYYWLQGNCEQDWLVRIEADGLTVDATVFFESVEDHAGYTARFPSAAL